MVAGDGDGELDGGEHLRAMVAPELQSKGGGTGMSGREVSSPSTRGTKRQGRRRSESVAPSSAVWRPEAEEMAAISSTGAPLPDSFGLEGEGDMAEVLVQMDFPGVASIAGGELVVFAAVSAVWRKERRERGRARGDSERAWQSNVVGSSSLSSSAARHGGGPCTSVSSMADAPGAGEEREGDTLRKPPRPHFYLCFSSFFFSVSNFGQLIEAPRHFQT